MTAAIIIAAIFGIILLARRFDSHDPTGLLKKSPVQTEKEEKKIFRFRVRK